MVTTLSLWGNLFKKTPGDINTNTIIVSNKVLYGKACFNYFIDYIDDRKVKSLCIILPKMYAYRRDFGKTKYMSRLIKDGDC